MKSKTITKVIRVSNETKKLMDNFYKDMKREKTPPYALFQANDGDTVVTLYESGKIVFQGRDADNHDVKFEINILDGTVEELVKAGDMSVEITILNTASDTLKLALSDKAQAYLDY